MNVGDRLRELRKSKGFTQDELGELVRVDGRQISRYENGHIQPTAKVLRRFAKVLEVSLEELLAASRSLEPGDAFQDKELYEHFLEVDQLDEDDRYVAKKMLQALIMKKQLQELTQQFQTPRRRNASS